MIWIAQAPSNIALIKYMGKTDESRNLPTNPSLSYTLPNLQTTVELTLSDERQDQWEPLMGEAYEPINLSLKAQERFLDHVARLKARYDYAGTFIVRSANNFPVQCGLASSASSFAALTQCAVRALSDLTETPAPSQLTQAQWSREGSGSSCRSFYPGWVLWEDDRISPVTFPYPTLDHQVILIDSEQKRIPSSQAHRRVITSPAFADRPQRARDRLTRLTSALQDKAWQASFQIVWEEFWDLHELFATSEPTFHYLDSRALRALDYLETFWQEHQDGPLVTMDAGPNIHCLYRPDQKACQDQIELGLKALLGDVRFLRFRNESQD